MFLTLPPHRSMVTADAYHATATQNGELTGKRILEVGCGQGSGASYLTRTFRPASYVGLDLNAAGIEFCRRQHQLPALEFISGHAENLPFPSESFDVVINIESSHFYPTRPIPQRGRKSVAPRRDVPLHRYSAVVPMRPMRGGPDGAGMRMVSGREINTEVLRGWN